MQPLTQIQREPLNWSGDFRFEGMIRIFVPKDGSCFFHALASAYLKPYIIGKIGDKHLNRSRFIRQLRSDLAKKLGSRVNPLDPDSPTHYETLSNGELPKIAETLPEYSLENMQRELDSVSWISNIYNEFISDELNFDIYILDGEKQDVYMTGTEDRLLYKNRHSIVILYLPGHYELVGVVGNESRSQSRSDYVSTVFEPTSPFITAIRDRMNQLRE